LLRAVLLVFGGIMLAVWGAIFAVSVRVLVERWRYKPLANDRPGRDWQMTPERFVDPESGRLVTVFFNPATGAQRYVAGGGKHP
jgi:hypothetical protein